MLIFCLASFRNRSSPDTDNGQFAPSSQLERSPSHSNAKLLLHKDKLIESLRLELAESQIKLVEMENRGGGRQRAAGNKSWRESYSKLGWPTPV
jgi:hypothetical protein